MTQVARLGLCLNAVQLMQANQHQNPAGGKVERCHVKSECKVQFPPMVPGGQGFIALSYAG